MITSMPVLPRSLEGHRQLKCSTAPYCAEKPSWYVWSSSSRLRTPFFPCVTARLLSTPHVDMLLMARRQPWPDSFPARPLSAVAHTARPYHGHPTRSLELIAIVVSSLASCWHKVEVWIEVFTVKAWASTTKIFPMLIRACFD
nr:hypothetical protein CFP56_56011 [Quercus suber]